MSRFLQIIVNPGKSSEVNKQFHVKSCLRELRSDRDDVRSENLEGCEVVDIPELGEE